MKWSNAQLKALEPTKGNMLISAGAGSGKTQVLSQKVHDVLASNLASPESILVVTFTVAAAFEMKQRIKQNLARNGVSKDIINKIDSAHIQTFDSFANFLVRKYASYLNISETINILDENILKIKIHEYIEEIIKEEYVIKSPIFLKTLKSTCIKNDENLKTIISDLFKKIETYEDKENILNNYDELYFNDEKVKKDYFDFVKLNKKVLLDGYELMFTVNDVEDTVRLGKLETYIEQLFETDEVSFYETLINLKFPSATRGADKEPFDQYKDKVLKLVKNNLEPYSNIEETLERVNQQKEEISYIISLVKKLDKKISEYKKETNSYTFNDIAKMSLKLFEIPELKAKIRESFKFILVDEYQDTSDIQERFINEISDNNVYMVGDIKQSIYRFRFANCDIFRDKYFLYKRDPNRGTKVDLVDNFRSRSEILNAVNAIFSNLMTAEQGGADYKVDHIINYGLKTYDDNIFDKNLYGVKGLFYTASEENSEDTEIRIVANKIIELFNNKTMVYDKSGKLRPINFSDIAILIRTKKDFNQYVKVFSDYNIPIACNTKNSFVEYEALLVTQSILSGVNYFRCNLDDEVVLKYIYASISRSFLYCYDDSKIYYAIKDGSYKNDPILEKCSRIAEFSLNNSIEDTFNLIILEFGIIRNLYKLHTAQQNYDKIEFLYGMCKNFDTSNLTISDFADFFSKLAEYKIDFEIETLDQTKNAVQLMSNHKSKGLEWPIVFLTGISGSKAGKTDTSIGKFNKIGGAFFKRYTGEQVVPFYNSYNNLIEKHEEASEAIRIFYVALTRARETLYMVCETDKYDGVAVPIINNRLFLNLLKVSKYDIGYEEGNVEPNFLEGHNLVIDIDDENKEIVEFCSVFEEKVSRTASHKVDENEITEQLQARLDFGIELHEHMETIDFRNPDTSHIKSPRTKQFIDKILQLDVFKECQSDKFIDAYKEYEFIDDNLHGFVDLFLLFEDRIEIIDYKLKNIDKPEYKEQLKTYKDYLEKIFKKRCRTYLISLVDCKIKEITHD